MINQKKKILIKKHLGENTPEWIINNCIAMLNEYEEVELDGYTKAKNNEALDLVSGSVTADDMKNEAIKFAMWCKQRSVFVYEYESNAHYNEKLYNEFKENYR